LGTVQFSFGDSPVLTIKQWAGREGAFVPKSNHPVCFNSKYLIKYVYMIGIEKGAEDETI
jgi:hypothetical protein